MTGYHDAAPRFPAKLGMYHFDLRYSAACELVKVVGSRKLRRMSKRRVKKVYLRHQERLQQILRDPK